MADQPAPAADKATPPSRTHSVQVSKTPEATKVTTKDTAAGLQPNVAEPMGSAPAEPDVSAAKAAILKAANAGKLPAANQGTEAEQFGRAANQEAGARTRNVLDGRQPTPANNTAANSGAANQKDAEQTEGDEPAPASDDAPQPADEPGQGAPEQAAAEQQEQAQQQQQERQEDEKSVAEQVTKKQAQGRLAQAQVWARERAAALRAALKAIVLNPEAIPVILAILVGIVLIAGAVTIINDASHGRRGADPNQKAPNVISNHKDIVELLAKMGNGRAKLQYTKEEKAQLLASYQQQLPGEKNKENQKVIQQLIDAVSAVQPGTDYSNVPDPDPSQDASKWTAAQKQKKALLDAYAAYRKVASTLTLYEAADKLIDWVNKHPKLSNQNENGTGGGGCWRTVDLVLRKVFPGSNPRGSVDGGDAQPFALGTSKPGVGPTSTDYETAAKALANGQLPVWHILGSGAGQHWVVVLAVNPVDQIVVLFDPAYGKIIVMSPTQTTGAKWYGETNNGTKGNYLGYAEIQDTGHGFPFTPPAAKAEAKP